MARGVVCLGVLASAGAALAQETPAAGGAINGGLPSSTATGNGTGAVLPSSDASIFTPPGLLQPTGFGPSAPEVRLGDLGSQLTPSLVGPSLQTGVGRAWTITPSLALTEEYISGGQGIGGNQISNQFITTVQPGIAVIGDTIRLHGELFYTPQVVVYSRDSSQDQIAQTFNGRVLATLVPGTFFLDLRGSGEQQAITPGQAPIGTPGQALIGTPGQAPNGTTTTLGRGNISQIYSFSVSPYALQRFGGWGTGEIGGTLGSTIQTALQPASTQPASTQQVLTALAAASNQNVTEESGHLAFVTGEAFARYYGAAEMQATSYSGSGVLQGAYQNTVTLDNGYALTRLITALATIGWEDIHYSGITPITIDDAIWNVGVRLLPNADSSITVRYGHQDGVTGAFVQAAYQATPRIHIYANYSKGLTTFAGQLQNALATSDLDALGNPIDHTTGAPLVPVGTFFGVTNSLYNTTLASVTVAWVLNRDSVSASVNRQVQTLVSAGTVLATQTGNSTGTFGTVGWSHELRRNLLGSVSMLYGTTTNTGSLPSDERSISASATLTYTLSPTVTGSLQYSFYQTTGRNSLLTSEGGTNSTQNTILIELNKTF
jgi:uncharacterized protein (PEP-CTERM system associated)